jgi:hypothetical protein
MTRFGIGARLACPLLIATVALASAVAHQTAPAAVAEEQIPEYVVKAGFLFNLAKYVAWPDPAFASTGAPIQIGIVGEDPFEGALERTLAEKSVHSRSFQIHRFRELADIHSVHILFVPRSESGRVAQILSMVDKMPVLTVGEQAAFATGGGMVAIVIEGQKPSLHINRGAVERQHLAVDSKLLRVATIVGAERP